ncbi:MAG: Hint domain-containing protein, partial [Planctomycetota bacterium]
MCGNAIGNVTAGSDAVAYIVGDFTGAVSAADYAGAVTLGDFHGSLSAGEAGFILSEGNVNAGMSTGEDLYVWAVGDVVGGYHAGRDASVITYGDFHAALAADRDIGLHHHNYYGVPDVWARGDISGTITAGRNIGHWDMYYGYGYESGTDFDVFSYGRIDAIITATNPSASPIGGRIGSVGAVGEIDGRIRAAEAIMVVHAGGAVTATLIAPFIGSVTELDAGMATAYQLPDLPASIEADVMAEIDPVYVQVLADRAQLAADITAVFVKLAAAKIEAAATLSEARSKTADAVADARQAAEDALQSDRYQELDELYGAAGMAAELLAELRRVLSVDAAKLRDAIAAIRAEHARSLAAADQFSSAAAWPADAKIAELRAEIIAAAQKEIEKWPDAWDDLVEMIYLAQIEEEGEGPAWWTPAGIWMNWVHNPIENIGAVAGSVAELGRTCKMQHQKKELFTRRIVNDCRYTTVQDFMNTYKLPESAVTLIRFLAEVGVGWSASGCGFVQSSVSMAGRTAMMRMGARQQMYAASKWCKSSRMSGATRWMGCFVAGTPVVDGLEEAFAPASIDAAAQGDAAFYWVLSVGALVGAAASWRRTDSRRRFASRERTKACDQVFDPPDCDDIDRTLPVPDDPDPVTFRAASDAVWETVATEPAELTACAVLDAPTAKPTMADRRPKRRCRVGRAQRDPRGTSVETMPKSAAPGEKPIINERASKRRLGLRFGLVGLWLLLAGYFGYGAITASSRPDRPATVAQQLKVHTTRIEQIQLGHRVLGENPELTDADRAEFGPEPDPATWRKLKLRAPKIDGTYADVELLRSLEWLEGQNAQVGGTVEINVPECGIEGDAEVLSIGSCPPIQPGPGHVVTGTFRHHAAEVLDLYVEGLDEPIRCTPNHPFWTEDRQKFVRADELHEGERLRTLDGIARVSALLPRDTPEPVYNLEVQREHVYQVVSTGILVHNGTACPEQRAVEAAQRHGGRQLGNDVYQYRFPSRRAARQAASEIAGDLGNNVQASRVRDYRGLPWNLRNSQNVMGKASADGTIF